MANQKQIKKRVSSVKNIGRIASALEMVAASKVQKSQEKALNTKPYAAKVAELVSAFNAERGLAMGHPLLRKPDNVEKTLIILVTTNRGLVGGLNTQLFGKLSAFLTDAKINDYSFITIGSKGVSFALTYGKLIADFSNASKIEEILPGVVNLVVDQFSSGEVDAVYLVFNEFITVMNYVPKIERLFPVTEEERDPQESIKTRFVFEPSPEEVLESLLTFYIETEIRDGIYEAEASEFAARMISMKNASDNASELSSSLNIEYNKARQQSITDEIADVVTSSFTVKK